MTTILTFLKEARVELGKVTWPTKERATQFTIIVVVVSVLVAAFLGGLDWVFGSLLDTFVLS